MENNIVVIVHDNNNRSVVQGCHTTTGAGQIFSQPHLLSTQSVDNKCDTSCLIHVRTLIKWFQMCFNAPPLRSLENINPSNKHQSIENPFIHHLTFCPRTGSKLTVLKKYDLKSVGIFILFNMFSKHYAFPRSLKHSLPYCKHEVCTYFFFDIAHVQSLFHSYSL